MKNNINDGWKVKSLQYSEDLLDIKVGLSDDGYEEITIPHDAVIHDVSFFYKDLVIWYKKELNIEKMCDKQYMLYFEGVYMDASIYINGEFAYRWVNGYTSFWFNATDFLRSGANTINVSIDYRCPNSRWYAGPGINRNVYLYELSNEHFVLDNIHTFTNKCDGLWKVNVFSKIDNKDNNSKIIYEIDDNHTVEAFCNDKGMYEGEIIYDNPLLWDVFEPNLYTLTAKIVKDDKIIDEREVVFGFREVRIDNNKGLFLNGNHIKINGACLHSDGGALGSAFNKDMARRQIMIMKEMGANALRLAHNVYAPEFMDLCDELGMMVLSEAFDCWRSGKNEYDYGRFFDEWCDKDIESWIKRDLNHPSIILWSCGNEIYDTHGSKEGRVTLNHIANEIKKYDFMGHAYITLCSNYMAWENTKEAVDDIKVAGYNYGERLYDEHHAEHPDWFIFGSETASCAQSRGVYHFPLDKPILVDDDMQCSALGNSTTSWGAKNLDFCIATERDKDYSLGQFLWSGIDYIGEPTPYHTKNSYLGIVDTALFPKDPYYMIKSEWTRSVNKSFIHMFPYWDFNEGQMIDVRITSSASRVELFKDGVSLGTQTIDHENGYSFYADYRLPYSKSELKAVAYDEDGNAVSSTKRTSFGDVKSLCLSCDEFSVEDGDKTLRFIEISALDELGNEVSNASSRVNINIIGPGKLIGLDNGDSTDNDSYKGASKRLFKGKLLAIVSPYGNKGTIKIDATIDDEDVPVRKIELKVMDNKVLSPDKPETRVKVNILPQNANRDELIFDITNESGVSIQNAQVKEFIEDENIVVIAAKADALFKLRVLNKEPSGRISYISELEMEAQGFGELNINPYEFVSGSLYAKSYGDIGNGNEKGISTSRTEDTWVMYENIDFGNNGSMEVTLPIFELDNQKTTITIWDGEPYCDGSEIICNEIYDKKSIWNVYQEQTFILNKVLKGIKNISVELHSQKIHLKGFIFKQFDKTYSINNATSADEIYGDSFLRLNDAVNKIGNNVSLIFRGFDFKEEGATKLIICGHTDLANNTIHIMFNNENDSTRQIVEFKGSSDFEEQYFIIDKISNKQDVTFLFLPGSEFDFKYFRFEK